jgi:hypothetical protein
MKRWKHCLAFVAAAGAFLFFVALIFLPPILEARFLAQAQLIQKGMSKEDVERLLGTPRLVLESGQQIEDLPRATIVLMFFIPPSPERWVYGRPFIIRIAGRVKEDVVVEFDSKGIVRRVEMPQAE